jgi:hypothetical protein
MHGWSYELSWCDRVTWYVCMRWKRQPTSSRSMHNFNVQINGHKDDEAITTSTRWQPSPIERIYLLHCKRAIMALGSSDLLVLGLFLAAVFMIQPGETATVDYFEGKNAECYDAQKIVDDVVYVKSTEMTRDAVQRALDDDLAICVKSGGHSYTCNFAKPGCFQIDMSHMNLVEISEEEGEGDTKRYFATMGPGALTRGETTSFIASLNPPGPWSTFLCRYLLTAVLCLVSPYQQQI